MNQSYRVIELTSQTFIYCLLDLHGMRLITHFPNIFRTDVTESRIRGLKIVQSVSHVTLSGKENSLQSTVIVRHLLCSTNLDQTFQELLVGQFRVSQNRTSRLNGLDDLGGEITRQSESSRTRVDLHGPPHGLLCCSSHTVSLI